MPISPCNVDKLFRYLRGTFFYQDTPRPLSLRFALLVYCLLSKYRGNYPRYPVRPTVT
jgi:hypothetical protein